MARKDSIHDEVKNALINDGWIITHDPLKLTVDDTRMEADLGAEKFIVAEKAMIKIIVEIKSFNEPSLINTFYKAFGQYLNYRDALIENNINRNIYLAVSEETYNRFDEMPFIKRRLNQYDFKLIVININNQTITKWIE